jgi:acetoin utilization deacetylase AcuC-like enzyme
MAATLLVEDAVFLDHHVPSGHVERPERLRAISEALATERFGTLMRAKATAADIEVLAGTHTDEYVDEIREASPDEGVVQIESDTYLSPKSFTVALHAAGAACAAVDAVARGEAANAFVASRPPGHHALADRCMGFCLFNNAVVAARHAQRQSMAERVAIVDWDVHHGNGTQDLVWADPTIFYGSTHQMPLYPGTGAGSERGVGNIVNAPLSGGTGGAEFRTAFTGRILPAVDSFAPDLIIVSAGFDAHWRDPLGGLNLTEDDFAWATRQVMEIADRHCGGRIVSLLEGGYDLTGLGDSVAAHVAALMGMNDG